jgi:hypothetical protein
MVWTPNSADPELFHITHVDNLSSILADGGLHCDAFMAERSGVTSIGDPAIKARRLHWALNLPSAPRVGGFVPFYFCPRSVMLYRIFKGHNGWNGGQHEVLHLVSRVSRVEVPGCVFTDSNAASAYHIASQDLERMQSMIDWSVMALEQWSGDPMKGRQAEFLVPGFVPWTVFDRIVVMSDSIARRVSTALGSTARDLVVSVDRSWYYNSR